MDVVVCLKPEKLHFLNDTLQECAHTLRASFVYSGGLSQGLKQSTVRGALFLCPESEPQVTGEGKENFGMCAAFTPKPLDLSSLKKIVVLQGEGNTGKTAILRCLQETLISGQTSTCSQLPQPHNNFRRRDRVKTLHYNGKTIAIQTAGDDANCIVNGFIEVQKQNAEELVIAVSVSPKVGTPPEYTSSEIVNGHGLGGIVYSFHTQRQVPPPSQSGYVDQGLLKQIIAVL